MSKWRFEPMPLEEAQRILRAGDRSIDTHADRISAAHLVERRYADNGWAPPPITSIYVRCEYCNATRVHRGRPCTQCHGRGYFETRRQR